MKARAGGFNPTPDQQAFIVALNAGAPATAGAPAKSPTTSPDVVHSTMGRTTFIPFESLFGIRVHFVTSVTNSGNVPLELYDVTYEVFSQSGAVIEAGDIPQAHPQKIGPGQTSLIGRTITADTATRVSDVASVRVRYKEKKANAPDNLLKVRKAEYRRSDQFGDVLVVGEIENTGTVPYDDVTIAVVLVDPSGAWIAYATASIPVGELKPGQVAQFVSDADLPDSVVRGRVADILVFACNR